jgi:hypothetical protein
MLRRSRWPTLLCKNYVNRNTFGTIFNLSFGIVDQSKMFDNTYLKSVQTLILKTYEKIFIPFRNRTYYELRNDSEGSECLSPLDHWRK